MSLLLLFNQPAGGGTVSGVADSSVTVTSTAVGTRVLANSTAASTVTVTAEATGTRVVFGVADSTITVTSTAVGTRVVSGAADSTVTVTSTATGRHPTANVTDNFTAGSLDAQWDDNSAGNSITGGRLRITIVNGEQYVGATNGGGLEYTLRDSQFSAEVPVVGTGGDPRTVYVLAYGDSNNSAGVRYVDGNLVAQFREGGADNNAGSVTYNSTDHRWWRVRAAGNVVHFEASADGDTWADPFGATRTAGAWIEQVSVYLGTIATGTGPGFAEFDNVNLAAGAATITGVATSTVTVTSTATGTRVVPGVADSSVTVASTAVGTRVVPGLAESTVTVTSTAAGTVLTPVAGVAASTITVTSTAVGTRVVFGVASSTITVTSTAFGSGPVTMGPQPITLTYREQSHRVTHREDGYTFTYRENR
jgi:hypothetical protein